MQTAFRKAQQGVPLLDAMSEDGYIKLVGPAATKGSRASGGTAVGGGCPCPRSVSAARCP